MKLRLDLSAAHQGRLYREITETIVKKATDFGDKEEKGDRNEARFSIDRYKTLFARILTPREVIPLGFVETGRKRDFYILTQIGKQFVSSFEIYRGEMCVYAPIRDNLQ